MLGKPGGGGGIPGMLGGKPSGGGGGGGMGGCEGMSAAEPVIVEDRGSSG
jgi:hypothetical protein